MCCVVITRTAGHSVAVCCDLLADLCSLLLPPCMQTIVCVSHSRGSSQRRNWRCCHTVVARNSTIVAAFSVRGMSCNPRTHTSIRPVLRPWAPQGPLMDGMMDKKRETRDNTRGRSDRETSDTNMYAQAKNSLKIKQSLFDYSSLVSHNIIILSHKAP